MALQVFQIIRSYYCYSFFLVSPLLLHLLLIFSLFLIYSVTSFENPSLSTARAPPAGICLSAHFIIRESNNLISSFKTNSIFNWFERKNCCNQVLQRCSNYAQVKIQAASFHSFTFIPL